MIRILRNGFLAIAFFPVVAMAQFQYSYTDFIHGFNDGAARFTTPNTAGLLSVTVDLGTVGFPNPNGADAIDVQADAVFSVISGQTAGPHVLMGHSMGGLTSRDSYLRHPQPATFAGIVTVATPHEGAPIADNALLVAGYAADQVTDFFQALINIGNRPTPGNILSQAAVNLIQSLILDVLHNNIMIFLADEFGVKSAGLNDIKTTSPTISRLDGQFDGLPHANVYGTIGRRNAVFRVTASSLYKDASFDTWIHNKNIVKSIVKVCRQIGWNWIIRTSVGSACNQVDHAIGAIDDRWAFFTMGNAEKRDASKTFDGLVPTSHTVYPGTTLSDPNVNFLAATANHMNIHYNPNGITAISNAMLKIGMRAPVNQNVDPVTVIGPTVFGRACGGTWNAQSGGVPPLHYVWTARGQTFNTGTVNNFDYTPTTTGTFTIGVTITDAHGTTGTGSKSVTASSNGVC
jgi:pimeloyl-ACP methyl ester carboxylesterase